MTAARYVCPECGEPVVHRPPNGVGTGTLASVDPARLKWSHSDGEVLCPVPTDFGREPAFPVRADPSPPNTAPASPSTTAPSGTTPRSTAKEAVVSTAEEPQDMQELATYLDTGVEEAEALNERARRLEEIAESDLRLTPRLTSAIHEAAGACKLAAEAVGELPGVLRSDLDV